MPVRKIEVPAARLEGVVDRADGPRAWRLWAGLSAVLPRSDYSQTGARILSCAVKSHERTDSLVA